jgi:hypothetical protein
MYEVSFHSYEQYQLKQGTRTSREEVTLFYECSIYLTEEKGDLYENMWPYFLFYYLSDEKIQQDYGVEKWKFILQKWRYWWSDYFSHILIESLPKSIFKDITEEQIKFQKLRESNLLSDIAKGCDEYIIQNVYVHGDVSSIFTKWEISYRFVNTMIFK